MRTMKFKTLSMAGMFLCLAGTGWVQEKPKTKQDRPDNQQASSAQSSTTIVRSQESGSKEATSSIPSSTMRKDVASDTDVLKWGQWLDDASLAPREEGTYWLGRSNNPKAIPYLLKALKDTEISVRQYSAGYLQNFRDKEIKPTLMEALKTEKSLLVQRAIIKSVRTIGANPTDEKMLAKYETELPKELRQLVLSGKNGITKTRAVWELVSLLNEAPEKYEDLMIKTLESNSTVEEKILAIRILKKTRTTKSASALRKALNDKNGYVRVEAESALKQRERK